MWLRVISHVTNGITLIIFLTVKPCSIRVFNRIYREHVISQYEITRIALLIITLCNCTVKCKIQLVLERFLIKRKTGIVTLHIVVFYYPLSIQIRDGCSVIAVLAASGK